ncbi:MAG: hypothetical protein AB7T31_11100 [Gemmatimonadales bacterium]
MRRLFGELARRHVLRVAGAYLVVAWLTLQVVDVLTPILEAPPWVGRTILLLAVAGLPITLILSWAFDLTPDGIKRTDAEGSTLEIRTAPRRPVVRATVGALVIVAVAYFAWRQLTSMTPSPTATDTAPVATPEAPTLAVLPFVNLSSDPEQDYFSDGLSEELLNHLARVPGLRVTGRTSAFAFKGHNEDLRAIGEQLGVLNILEGSVRRSGTRLRIQAQLVSAVDGLSIWTASFDRELDDVFAIQEEVARAVTNALGVTLTGTASGPAVQTGGTANLEAYDRYLRARGLFLQSGSLQRAVEIYREALALDPQFALAWYGLYTALGYALVSSADPVRVQAEMNEASARMVALAPDAWWTQAMRADQLFLQRRWAEAEEAATAALAAAPASEVDALVTYATVLMGLGRVEEGVESLRLAQVADPLSLRVSGLLQIFLDAAGRRDEADAEYQRSKDLVGGRERWEWAALLRSWAREGQEPVAIEEQYRAYLRITEGEPRSYDLVLVEQLDDVDAMRATLRQAFDDPAHQFPGRMTSIYLYADLVGDEELAITALRRAFLDLDKVNFEGLWWPFQTDLRRDPRFKDVVRRLGLVEYWRASGNWGDFARPLGTRDFEIYR